ncbi:tetratricopeptide repeat protein [Mediterraneibacter sp. ICN-202921]|jgi:tetratricopeptide (TPR) repeat protein|uniref:tetratricopeptide repeat protein n=1 Tax=Mediterraneibacter sp. ICN-202921 TaxID=3134657 RepID=UPI000E4CCF35|nr:hypothetical protein DWX08_01435 [Ruminococcus sp. AF18-22]
MKIKKILPILCAVCLLTGCTNALKDGTKQMEEGNYDKAAACFTEAVQKEENAAEAYRGLGMALYEQKEYKGALEAWENALAQGIKESPQMYNLIGISAMQTEDYAGAYQYFETGIALSDARAAEETIDGGLLKEMRYNVIVCAEKSADWETAKEKITEYLELYPDDEKVMREAAFLKTR